MGPKAGRPSNFLKIHPITVFSLLTAQGLVQHLGGSWCLATPLCRPFAVECHLHKVTTVLPQHSQRHSSSQLPHGQSWCNLGMWSQGSENAGRHSALTLEGSASWQAWRSHILETRQFLLGRGLKTHSLLMCFLPRRKIAFSKFCMLRVSHCLKSFSWRLFFIHNFP